MQIRTCVHQSAGESCRDLKLLTASLSACAKLAQWQKALLVLQGHRLQANVITFASAVNACAKGAAWRWSLQLLNNAADREVQGNVIMRNSALASCAQTGGWQLVQQLLNGVQHVTLQANVITHTSAINSYKSDGRWQPALSALCGMQQRGIQPNAIAYNAAISTIETGDFWQVLPDIITFNTVTSVLAFAHEWQRAELLLTAKLRLLQLDVFSFASAISACDREQVEANVVAYNAAISACQCASDFAQVRTLLEEMQHLEVVLKSYTISIKSFGRVVQWQRALLQLDELKTQQVLLDQVLYTSVIIACGNAGKWRWVLSLLRKLLDEQMNVDVVTCTAAITALGRQQRWQAALLLFEELSHWQVKANVVAYNAAIRSVKGSSNWPMALWFLKEQAECSLKGDIVGSVWQLAALLLHALPEKAFQADILSRNTVLAAHVEEAKWLTAPATRLRYVSVKEELGYGCVTWGNVAQVTWSRRLSVARKSFEPLLEHLHDEFACPLEVVNDSFAKTISILRLHRACSEVLDQDGWAAKAPLSLFPALATKLQRLAGAVQVPVFAIQGMAPTASTAPFSVLRCRKGSGELCISNKWTMERSGWRARPKPNQPTGSGLFWGMAFEKAVPQLLAAAATWGVERSCQAVAVVEDWDSWLERWVEQIAAEEDLQNILGYLEHFHPQRQFTPEKQASMPNFIPGKQQEESQQEASVEGKQFLMPATGPECEAGLFKAFVANLKVEAAQAEVGEGQMLALLDLADPEALTFLRERQKEPELLHVVVLLPSLASTHVAWQPVAEPLALLLGLGEEILLDTGLVLVLNLGADESGLDVSDALSLLEALASADLAAVAFQLQPRPQAHLALVAFEVDATPILCAESAALAEEEVLASFTLWPCTEEKRLLKESFLQSNLPPCLARAGAAYQPAALSTSRPRVWHLMVHVPAEASICRRAAGDFGGRALGAFAWRRIAQNSEEFAASRSRVRIAAPERM
ncbi:unnamed protein product [Symbiodinium pilosum]|uniref:Pentatricopeptide repeat-containing protein, chloroplastic n=1 Tax=Symbiodinium pilosum TaxID=2952 RepID=A0A812TVD9_SYMPI|nr:unnamed protein product [Symbiodinium pilosum]